MCFTNSKVCRWLNNVGSFDRMFLIFFERFPDKKLSDIDRYPAIPKCPTILIRTRSLLASGIQSLSINIQTSSELINFNLLGHGCCWHCCTSANEGRTRYDSNHGQTRAGRALVRTWESLGIHLESMSVIMLNSHGTCSMMYLNPWSLVTQRHSLSRIFFLKFDSLNVGSNKKMRFRWSVKRRKWSSLSSKRQSSRLYDWKRFFFNDTPTLLSCIECTVPS